MQSANSSIATNSLLELRDEELQLQKNVDYQRLEIQKFKNKSYEKLQETLMFFPQIEEWADRGFDQFLHWLFDTFSDPMGSIVSFKSSFRACVKRDAGVMIGLTTPLCFGKIDILLTDCTKFQLSLSTGMHS